MSLRKQIRQRGIAERDALSAAVRESLSSQAVERLIQWEPFQQAQTILLYEHIKGELSLDALMHHPKAIGKRFLWPRCIGEGEMLALAPCGDDAWQEGCCGIREPIPERSNVVPPEEIDLVVCPCTAFDDQGHRMGMGGGFYDRYLPQCRKAAICAIAFEAQKVQHIPCEIWDFPMDAVITEKSIYRGK